MTASRFALIGGGGNGKARSGGSFGAPLFAALITAVCAASAPSASAQGLAQLQTGKPAPDFKATGVDGKPVSLAGLRGKAVVLEWTSPACPFTVKKYDQGAMQALQKQARADGLAWVVVNTSGPGMPGHLTPSQAKARVAKEHMTVSAFVLDETGKLGRAWGAKATPQVFIVDRKGVLVFQGGVDADAYAKEPGKAGAAVGAALADLKAHRAIAVADVKPYGCPVEYPAL